MSSPRRIVCPTYRRHMQPLIDFVGPSVAAAMSRPSACSPTPWPISQCWPGRTVNSFPIEPTLTTI
jgi:hypothetical protein